MRKFVLLGWVVCCSLVWAQQDMDFAYLGVHTSRLDNGLSHQLGLPLGAHLKVERVVTGSPAEDAGIKLFDILIKLDDQLLINPDQLKTLVQMRNSGECITLSILRQSKPLSVLVELTEAPQKVLDSVNRDWMDERGPFNTDQFFGPNDRFRDFFRRHSFDFPNLKNFHHPFFSYPQLDDPSVSPSPAHGSPDDPLHAGDTDVQSYSYSSSTQQITVNDEFGSLQWTEKDGLRFLRATDLKGRVLYEGSITSQDELNELPVGVRDRLRTLQRSGQIPEDRE